MSFTVRNVNLHGIKLLFKREKNFLWLSEILRLKINQTLNMVVCSAIIPFILICGSRISGISSKCIKCFAWSLSNCLSLTTFKHKNRKTAIQLGSAFTFFTRGKPFYRVGHLHVEQCARLHLNFSKIFPASKYFRTSVLSKHCPCC